MKNSKIIENKYQDLTRIGRHFIIQEADKKGEGKGKIRQYSFVDCFQGNEY